MFNFDYSLPTQVVFGKNTEAQVGELVKEFGGKRVLIHYGGQSAVKSGLLGRVKAALDAAEIFHVEVGGVVPNPHLGKVREGVSVATANDVDFILAVGGGSVIDSAKAIAFALGEPDKDVWELFEHKRDAVRAIPVGVILTIAAAGSETSTDSVITNEVTGEKRAYGAKFARPRFAIMNPELTMTLPDYQSMAGATDIMMHTMERYFTSGKNMELTDRLAAGIIKTVMKYAKVVHEDPQNYDARAEIMWAGSLAHNDLTGCGNNAPDWATHMLEHELGGMFDVTHGAGLAAIWPSWARYVYRDNLDHFVKFATDFMDVEVKAGMNDEEIALAGIAAMEEFYHSIGMPINMKELGITPTEEQILELAESCREAVGGRIGSAKVLYQEDMINIYKMAL